MSAPATNDWDFMRACDLARTADESFKLAWIASIEATWQVADLDNGASGFILAMADGRRLYWRYTSDDPGAGRVEDLQVTELAADEMPEGEAPWVKPDRLNERLAVLRRLM
jgi:hypothetical protein